MWLQRCIYTCEGEDNNYRSRGSPAVRQADESNKQVIFKNCGPFSCKAKRKKNTKTDKAKDMDVVMLMYNLIKYSDNYSKTSESLWQY